MRIAIRVVLVLAVFITVGLFTAHAVLHHAAQAGAYEPEVKLGADMAGLFAGGIAATVTLLAALLSRNRF